jgi:hypothetical protein
MQNNWWVDGLRPDKISRQAQHMLTSSESILLARACVRARREAVTNDVSPQAAAQAASDIATAAIHRRNEAVRLLMDESGCVGVAYAFRMDGMDGASADALYYDAYVDWSRVSPELQLRAPAALRGDFPCARAVVSYFGPLGGGGGLAGFFRDVVGASASPPGTSVEDAVRDALHMPANDVVGLTLADDPGADDYFAVL